MQEKLKSWISNDQVFYGLLLILVGLGSFALGRLSIVPSTPNSATGVDFMFQETIPVLVQAPTSQESQSVALDKTSNLITSVSSVVGSKSGSKYHLPTCAGAKQIKPENLVTFATIVEAERAGYTPAANCPGLQ